jgi:hypothetical protein
MKFCLALRHIIDFSRREDERGRGFGAVNPHKRKNQPAKTMMSIQP